MPNTIPPELMALLEELSQGGIAEDQQTVLAERLRDSRDMRDTPMPKRMHALGQDRFGTIMAPSNPLEYVNSGLRQVLGGQATRGIQDQMAGNVDTTGRGVRALMLAKLLRDNAAPPGPAALQPENAAMMSPDPSTMTSEAIPFAEGFPWDDPWAAPKPPPKARRAPVGPPAAPNSYGTTGEW